MFIYLIGMMGSGKSIIGKYLSLLTSYPLLDSDNLLIRWKNKTISEIFSSEGEDIFREYERQLLKAIVKNNRTKQKLIFSTGGGMPCFHDNINTMLNSGKVFYLKNNAETLFNRINNTPSKRPILKDMNLIQFERLLAKREECYMKADYIIEKDSIKASAKAILKKC